jgi:ribosome-associated translation inhibitor RaiA
MLSENRNDKKISVRFTHIHPSDHSVDFIRQELSHFQEKLPQKSVLQVAFTKRNDLVKATLQVFSPAGKLFTTATSNSIRDACLQAVHHLARKAEKIKNRRHRFHREKAAAMEMVSIPSKYTY